MIPLEAIGWFCLGFGSLFLVEASIYLFRLYRERNRKTNFDAFIERIKSSSNEDDQPYHKGKEISEFSFRDMNGKLATVKIVIDHDLPDQLVNDPNEMDDMIEHGEAGTMDDLIKSNRIISGPMREVEEFVFSPRAIRNMRAGGMEPDEVVVKMLKASGRMP